MKLGSFLFMCSIATVLNCNAQKIELATSAAVTGFSAERFKTIDDNLNDWVKKGWMNGAVGLIIRNGKVAYYKPVGFNEIDTKDPMKKDDIFRILHKQKQLPVQL